MGLRDVVAKRKAERERPKTLAELRAAKQAKPKSLAELRASKQSSNHKAPRAKSLAELRAQKGKSSKLDFVVGGIRYHNVVQHRGGWWTVDVSNGDMTYTLNNRCGSWFHDVSEVRMVEPVRVARALGTDLTQLEISQNLSARLEREFKERGILTHEELLRQHEEEAKKRRRRSKQGDDD